MNNTAHGKAGLGTERELHAAVSHPKHIPVIAIRRDFRRHGGWQAIQGELANGLVASHGLWVARVRVRV